MTGAAPPSSARLLLRNAAFLTSSQVLARGLVMIVQVVLARTLSRDDLGLFFLAFGYYHLVGQVCDFGLRSHTLREVSMARSAAGSLAGEVLTLRLLLGAVALVVLAPLLGVLGYTGEVVPLLLVASGGGVLEYAAQNLKTVFRAHERSELDAAASLANRALLLGIVVVLWARGALTPASVVVAMAAIGAVELGVIAVLLRRLTGRGLRLAAPSARMVAMLRAAFAFFLITLVVDVARRLPPILLERWNGRDATAVYGVASRLFEAGAFVPVALMGAVLPRIVQLARGAAGLRGEGDHRFDLADARQREAAARAYGALVFVMVLVLAGPLLFAACEAPRIVALLFGAEYLDAVPTFRMLALWLGAVALANLAGNPLIVAHRERQLLAAGATTALLLAVVLWVSVAGRGLSPAEAALRGAAAMTFADLAFCGLLLALDRRLGLLSFAALRPNTPAARGALAALAVSLLAPAAIAAALVVLVPGTAITPLVAVFYLLAAVAGAATLAGGLARCRSAVRGAGGAGAAGG